MRRVIVGIQERVHANLAFLLAEHPFLGVGVFLYFTGTGETPEFSYQVTDVNF